MSIAFVRNDSGRPDGVVEEIVGWAHDYVGIERVRVAVRVWDGAGGGHASGKGHRAKWQGRTKYAVSLSVPPRDDDFLLRVARVCWHSTGLRAFFQSELNARRAEDVEPEQARDEAVLAVYTELAARYDRGERRFGRWPIYRIGGWEEHLVHLAAHELTHVLAWERGRRGNAEVWIEEVAARALEAWRGRGGSTAGPEPRPGGGPEVRSEAAPGQDLTNALGGPMIQGTGQPAEPQEAPMTEQASVTIKNLTPLNVSAIREALAAKGVRVHTTATSATFEQMTREQAYHIVQAAIRSLPGRAHPKASLHAVARKLATTDGDATQPLVETQARATHRFASTGEAYDASQTHDDIRDGDILIVEPEGVVGIMVKAWPTAVGEPTGKFHTLADGVTWETLDGGAYAGSFADALLQAPKAPAAAGRGGNYKQPDPEWGTDAEGFGPGGGNQPGAVTLVAKTDGKTPWHILRKGDSAKARTVCGRPLENVHVESDIDARTVRYKGRPVCTSCTEVQAHNSRVRGTTTEEVTMSTTATERTQARPDPKGAQAEGRSQARSTTKDAEPEIADGLDKALLAQVKKAVPKVEAKAAPSGAYTVVKSDGNKVGTLHPQTRKGALVLIALAPSTVKQFVKGAEVEKYEKNVIKSRLYVTKPEQVEQVALALKEAAKQQAAK